MTNSMRYLISLFITLLSLSSANAAPEQDAYIAGYAAGILRSEFKLEKPELNVKNGVITVRADDLKNTDQPKVMSALSSIPGVTGVKMVESDQPMPSATKVDGYTPQSGSLALETGLMPSGHLFKPLLADPRWAHFSAAYHYYTNDNFDGNNIGSVSFGETIPFYRQNFGFGKRFAAQWEAGLQAGVFSDFNLGASSSDLINTDFIASIYSSVRVGEFSAFGRIYHQSSHLGDEFLLRTRTERVNLSYEGVDLKLSYELPYGVRVYGGGGGLFHTEPSTLKPWSAQYGIEFRSPWRWEAASMRPIIAADFKNFDENDWKTDVSARAGVQFDNLQVMGRNLQILGEYFNGYSPSGQFYNDKVKYFGVGAHFHF
ncbi:MAG: DUF1207 domain-containing protein [Methylovulum sp.]